MAHFNPLHVIADLPVAQNRIATINLRSRPESRSDLRLVMRRPFHGAEAQFLATHLRELAFVEEVVQKKEVLQVRLTGDCLGVGLMDGSSIPPFSSEASNPHRGKRYAVNFLDPNATKALHVGHLRNLALGNALSNSLMYCGAEVRRTCLVCDIGRAMSEAIVGYRLLGKPRFNAGQKSDHAVGEFYRHAQSRLGGQKSSTSPNDQAIAREVLVQNDEADQILSNWDANASDVREDWTQLRDWAMQGQAESLQRLGIVFDGILNESDTVESARALCRGGVESGVLTRLDDGRIIWNTGSTHYDAMTLCRSDGFPTEHCRLLVAIHARTQRLAPDCITMTWGGLEWRPAGLLYAQLLELLYPEADFSRIRRRYYAMVTIGGDPMKSSGSNPVLIDALLQEINSHSILNSMLTEFSCAGSNRKADLFREALCEIICKLFFLSVKATKPIEFSWHRIFDATHQSWSIARAFLRTACSAGTSDNQDYQWERLLFVQSLDFDRKVLQSIEEGSFDLLFAYTATIAECISHCESSRTARAAGFRLLRRCLFCLGVSGPAFLECASREPEP